MSTHTTAGESDTRDVEMVRGWWLAYLLPNATPEEIQEVVRDAGFWIAQSEPRINSLAAVLAQVRQQERERANAEIERLQDGLEMAWVIIANASGGNWDHPANSKEWKPAAEDWRDRYLEDYAAPLRRRLREDAK